MNHQRSPRHAQLDDSATFEYSRFVALPDGGAMVHVGDLVRHERMPTWGVGVVVAAQADTVRIHFENHKATTINLTVAGAALVQAFASDIEADSPLLDPQRWHECEAAPENRIGKKVHARCRHCGEPLRRARRSHDNALKSCPRCSTVNGQAHVFYESPLAFGTSEHRESAGTPDGVQSHCIACRRNTATTFVATMCDAIRY